MSHDLRLAVRGLWASPIFSLITICTLAIGLGATIAIFSVVHSVLLNPLDIAEPDRVIYLRDSRLPQFPSFAVSPGNFSAWQRASSTFDSMAAVSTSFVILTGTGEPERLRGDRATATLFPLLGVTPVAGRFFRPEEDRPGAEPVVVLSEGLWRRRFGGAPDVVGRSLTLSGRPHTVVGVAPASLTPVVGEVQLWVPMAFDQQEAELYGSHYLRAYGRLRSGATLEQAAADLDRIAVQLEQALPGSNNGWRVLATPLPEFLVRNVRTTLWALAGAVVVVLLVVCANVASLTLARGLARQRELALRVALGAGRGRLVRELLAEGAAIAALAGGLGLFLAWAILRALVTFGPATIPRLSEIGLYPEVLLFALALTAVAPLLFSLMPAIQAARGDVRDALSAGGRTVRTTLRARTRGALVIGQIALALMLLVGSMLLVRSFVRLLGVDPGFNPANALAVGLQVPSQKYPEPAQRLQVQTRLMDRVRSLPGVVAVGLTQSLPLVNDMVASLDFEGQAPVAPADRPSANFYSVSGGFFEAMGIRLIRGRTFSEADRAGAPAVAIVNETFARRFYAGQDPIGRRFRISQGRNDLREIVGIVADTRQYGLAAETPAQVYEPYEQQPFSSVDVISRTAGDPAALTSGIRAALREIDPDQPLGRAVTLDTLVGASMGSQQFSLALFAGFAAITVLLAAIGLYGLVAYTVSQRTPEIGIRLALGARPHDLVRMIVRHGVMLGAIGMAIGLAGALAASRLLSSLLFETSPNDLVTYLVVPLVLLFVVVIASLIPARRAAAVDPVASLRA